MLVADKKMSGVREAAYTTLVRPQLEYAAAIWDPNHDDKIKQIEKVQRRAARWTTCNFGRTASVTDMIELKVGVPLNKGVQMHVFVYSLR